MAELDRVLMVSHEDFDPYASLLVEFDDEMNLNIILDWEFSDEPSMNYRRIACVDKENAFYLAKKKKIHLVELPEHFYKKFRDDSFCATAREVEDLFAEVVDYLLDNKVGYKIK